MSESRKPAGVVSGMESSVTASDHCCCSYLHGSLWTSEPVIRRKWPELEHYRAGFSSWLCPLLHPSVPIPGGGVEISFPPPLPFQAGLFTPSTPSAFYQSLLAPRRACSKEKLTQAVLWCWPDTRPQVRNKTSGWNRDTCSGSHRCLPRVWSEQLVKKSDGFMGWQVLLDRWVGTLALQDRPGRGSMSTGLALWQECACKGALLKIWVPGEAFNLSPPPWAIG